VLELVNLLEKAHVPVKDLTLVDLRKIELARALATHPKLLLIDEIMAGLNPAEVLQTMESIRRIRDEFKITIFWVEHVMKAIMNLCDRVVVLHMGEKIAEGKPAEIAADQNVIKCYLGE
jgi:branched-chain amino acid transport system ATP-binding protein